MGKKGKSKSKGKGHGKGQGQGMGHGQRDSTGRDSSGTGTNKTEEEEEDIGEERVKDGNGVKKIIGKKKRRDDDDDASGDGSGDERDNHIENDARLKSGSKLSEKKGRIDKSSQEQEQDQDLDLSRQLEGLEFEDPFEDEVEVDEIEGEAEEDEDEEDDDDEGEVGDADADDDDGRNGENEANKASNGNGTASQGMDTKQSDNSKPTNQIFRPGVDALQPGEELDFDSSAYVMLHRMQFEWPALSFDFFKDPFGTQRTRFPQKLFFVAGTQPATSGSNSGPNSAATVEQGQTGTVSPNSNEILVIRAADLSRTKDDENEDALVDLDPKSKGHDGADDDFDDDPTMETRRIKHIGGINRIRSMPQHPEIVCSWSDSGRVHLWNFAPQLATLGFSDTAVSGVSGSASSSAPASSIALTSKDALQKASKPMFSFRGHKDEGFAMDWSRVQEGQLATGDCSGNVFTWQVTNDQVVVDQTPFKSPEFGASIEDIQWSPTEKTVLATCSIDKTVRIWDTRKRQQHMLHVNASETDVNVIAWNPTVSYLVCSGADDGCFKIWDLRMLKQGQPVGTFSWHQSPITSVEWSPHDESVICVSCDDHSTSIWDLALEEDPEHARATEGLQEAAYTADGSKLDIPPQLLFLHQGQQEPKEAHFHSQIPGLVASTSADGFDIWIPEPLESQHQ